MASVNLSFIFFCQAVDLNHPTQATAVKWIEAFARHPKVRQVVVLPLRAGEFSLPDNVTVIPLQQGHRLLTLFSFYRQVVRTLVRQRIDFFWISQGGPYPLLLLPFKLLLRKPVYQWKAHPHISVPMQIYARWCDTRIFTSTPNAFPLPLPKVKVVGQGIDVARFTRLPGSRKLGDIVTTGRITPRKRLDAMLRVLDLCKRRYGMAYRFDIYGSEERTEPEYKAFLDALIRELDLSEQVAFKGMVTHTELPARLNGYRVFLNLSETALDKSAVEAMACGIPVVSSNTCVADILPHELRQQLVVPPEDIERIAETLHAVLSQSEDEVLNMGDSLRRIVVQHHSVEGLIDNILAEIGGS